MLRILNRIVISMISQNDILLLGNLTWAIWSQPAGLRKLILSVICPASNFGSPLRKKLDPTIIANPSVNPNATMASYDSDSSDGEFEETNVLLGYASRSIEEGDDTISHLGGKPVRDSTSKLLCNPRPRLATA
jgi:hypothetical protein